MKMPKPEKRRGTMAMEEYERSSMDKKADKSGKHGEEGSVKDLVADKRDLKRYNAKIGNKAKK